MLELALFAQVLFWLLVVGAFFLSRQASIYHPLAFYLGFHALVFVIRPLVVHYLEFDHEFVYMQLQPTEQIFIRSLMVSSLGLFAFATAALGIGLCEPIFKPHLPAPFTVEQRRGLLVLTLVLAPLLGYSMYASHTDFAAEDRGGTFIMTGAGGYTIEAQLMAGPLVCACLAVTRFRWYALALLVPYVTYRAYSGMSRWTFVLLFIALGLMYAWQKRLKWPPWWFFIGMLPIFCMFKALGDNRTLVKRFIHGESYRTEEIIGQGATALERFRTKYDGPDFANFDFLTFVIAAVPEKTQTYTYGSQYLQLFTEPIPRKLWPGKPAGAPIGFFNLNHYGNFIGRTVSLVGDGWMSGGWLGVAITMTIVGGLLGLAHRWFWRHSEDNMVALFYLVGLAMLPQWFRDGGISIAKFLFWNLAPLVLWRMLAWVFTGLVIPGGSVVLPAGVGLRLVRTGRNLGTRVLGRSVANTASQASKSTS